MDLDLAVPRVNGSDPGKRSRFHARHREMVGHGTWVYFPARDLYVEKFSIQSGRWNSDSPGRPRFMPCLEVYGREVYECPPWKWKLFLEYHPRAVCEVHAKFHEPSEGGLVDVDAHAVHCEGGGMELVR